MDKEIKNIDKAKNAAVEELSGNIDNMEKAANDFLEKLIEATLEIREGQIQTNAAFVKQLNKLADNYLKELQGSIKFTGPVGKFIKKFSGIYDAVSEFQASINNIKVPKYSSITKVINDEIIDKMLDNGLNQYFVQPLRNLIYQNATSGLSLTNAKRQLNDYIRSGKDKSGKLKSYLEQTSVHAVDSYSGMINKKLLEDFKYDGLLITGTLIDNSSPQCIFAIEDLKGLIKRSDWTKLKGQATERAKLIEGTTFDNLPLNRLHWGCRHSFYPVIITKSLESYLKK